MRPSFTRNQPLHLLLVASLALAAQAFAQDDAARIETEQRSRELNGLRSSPAPSTAEVTDPELGDISLVSRAPRPKTFTFWTTQTINFTSNAFLVRDNEDQAFFWNGRAGASVVPYATRNFTPRLSFEQNWFRYDHLSNLDFDSQTLQLDLKYDLNRDDSWFVNGSYLASRLTSPHSSIGEFYRYGLGNLSLTHFGPVGNGPFHLGVTGGGYWRTGDESSSDRVAAYLSVLGLYPVCDTVQLAAFTRPEFQHYTHDPLGSRDDFNVSVGATLSWIPRDYLSLNTTVSYTGNFSSLNLRRYDVFTPSLVLGAQFSF